MNAIGIELSDTAIRLARLTPGTPAEVSDLIELDLPEGLVLQGQVVDGERLTRILRGLWSEYGGDGARVAAVLTSDDAMVLPAEALPIDGATPPQLLELATTAGDEVIVAARAFDRGDPDRGAWLAALASSVSSVEQAFELAEVPIDRIDSAPMALLRVTALTPDRLGRNVEVMARVGGRTCWAAAAAGWPTNGGMVDSDGPPGLHESVDDGATRAIRTLGNVALGQVDIDLGRFAVPVGAALGSIDELLFPGDLRSPAWSSVAARLRPPEARAGHGWVVTSPRSDDAPVVELHQVGGPSAGGTVALAPGRHAIGPAPDRLVPLRPGSGPFAAAFLTIPADLHCSIEPSDHHGAPMVTVDGEPVDGPVHLTDQIIGIGTGSFRITPVDAQAAATGVELHRAAAPLGAATQLPDLAELLARARRRSPALWVRRSPDQRFTVAVAHRNGSAVPRTVSVDLADTTVMLGGDREITTAVAAAVVAQAACLAGPADLTFHVPTGDDWAWVGRLPHQAADPLPTTVLAVSAQGASGPLTIDLSTGPVVGSAVRFDLDDDGRAALTDEAVSAAALGIPGEVATVLADHLGPLVDPEVPTVRHPTIDEVLGLVGVPSATIAEHWRQSAGRLPHPLPTVAGVSAETGQPLLVDLATVDGPVVVSAAHTALGQAAADVVAGAVWLQDPDRLEVVVVDPAGRLDDDVLGLPHVAVAVSAPEPDEIEPVLHLLRRRSRHAHPGNELLVVMVGPEDLGPELAHVGPTLVDLAVRGRASGVSLTIATTAGIDEDLDQLSAVRMAVDDAAGLVTVTTATSEATAMRLAPTEGQAARLTDAVWV